jgi:hypothetical protein
MKMEAHESKVVYFFPSFKALIELQAARAPEPVWTS